MYGVQTVRKGKGDRVTEQDIAYMTNPENAFGCPDCPENKHDPDYKVGGRLPCGQWQCWVVLKSETWRKKNGRT